MTSIVWFRQDLRLSDNHALVEAASLGKIIPVFIYDETDRPLGGASKWWLHHSLSALEASLGSLVLLRGNPKQILPKLLDETNADRVFWNRSYEPHTIERDRSIKSSLKADGREVKSFPGSIIYEPWEIETLSGGPYKVYSPFWKSIQARGFPAPLAKPAIELAELPPSDSLSEWNLLPKNPNWANGWEELWVPGEEGAKAQFDAFMENGIKGYGELRDRPDLPNVSRLSPHIHFGEISPRQLCTASAHKASEFPGFSGDIKKFQAEVAWRDFANHLLYHFPTIPEKNWKPAFDAFPWEENAAQLNSWQQGNTGYPMIDAGMRELWHTGYMHNRVRMLVASFLVKHLRIHWKEGEAWFWDTLLDADLANNTSSWQWVAGSGADAAPYFRIFNPLTQGPKFDPKGEYVRKWCPELAQLPDKFVHAPFEAEPHILHKAGVRLGETYPKPIVDHKKAREAALAGYEAVKQSNK